VTTPPPPAAPLLLGAWLALGLAHLSFLPPWEGFDEPAHFSYVQQIAATGTWPARHENLLSADVEAYLRVGPMPYGTLPPAATYERFFQGPPETVAAVRRLLQDSPARPRTYVPSRLANWERKHPPLGYALLAPVFRLTADRAWAVQIWWLRAASYLAAWAALVIVVAGCGVLARRADGPERAAWQWAALGVALWPACFPAWFPAMARLGNDGLSALVASLLWLALVVCGRRTTAPASAAIFGVILGLGGLVKAYFLAIAPAVALYVLSRRDLEARRSRRLAAAALVLGLAAAVPAWWYLQNGQPYASVLLARRGGGLAAALAERFSLHAWIRGHAALVASFSWPGSWSFARPPYGFFVPLAGLVVVLSAAAAWTMRRVTPAHPAVVPLWLAAPVAAALSYYVLVRVALTGEGRLAAGYYLHVLAGPLGTIVGLAAGTLWSERRLRRLTAGLVTYALAFAAAMTWAQILLFAGLLTRAPDRFYAAPAPLPPWLGVPEALHRLEVLARPQIGLAAGIAGVLLLVPGLMLARQLADRLAPPALPLAAPDRRGGLPAEPSPGSSPDPAASVPRRQ
jgi:hypothetical protein